MRKTVDPKVIIEGDKVVIVMGVDRLELPGWTARVLGRELSRAAANLHRVQ